MYRTNDTTEKQTVNTVNIGFEAFEALATMCRGSVYLIDFEEQCFRYVSNHDLFLCGHTRDEVLQLGYDFYPELIHPNDMFLLKRIYQEIVTTMQDVDKRNTVNHFSFKIRIKAYPQQRKHPRYLMGYHKLTPLYVNGLIFGICLLSCSVVDKEMSSVIDGESNEVSGELRLYYRDNMLFEEFSFKNNRWKTSEITHLNEREKVILRLAMCGMDYETIAQKLCLTRDCINKNVGRIFEKLNVCTKEQAIITAINQSLIFSTYEQTMILKQENEVRLKNEMKKCKSNKITTFDRMERIQICINNGEKIREIAKKECVPESTIRYNIGVGKLTKHI
jgi:DNA-binding NarL/FixJ family response regulator